MIAFISGHLKECSPTVVWIDCGGVGYELQISLVTFEAIKQLDQVFLFTHLQVKEDSHTLFGFSDKSELRLFRLLIQVSGISGNTARMILSSIATKDLIQVIYTENKQALQKIKGIGGKTADRILLELKSKVHQLAEAWSADTSQDKISHVSTVIDQKQNDVLQALQSLGINKQQAVKAFAKIDKNALDEQGVEALIKQALANL